MVNITGSTQLLGVMGCPIRHSLSPVLHNAALETRALALGQSNLEYVYLPLEVQPADLEIALLGLAATGWRGLNVTIPHKQTVMQYLQNVSPLARSVGAVNTIWRQEGEWFGTNTDVRGFLAPLLKGSTDWAAVDVCVLGAGGAARATIAACAQLGCRSIHVVGRSISKLKSLQRSFLSHDPSPSFQIHDWQALDKLLPTVGLLVNTTPMGMHPQVEQSPLSVKQVALLPTRTVVYDLIYTPRPSLLLTLAQQHGCFTIDGLEMLIHQGAAAFEIWVGEAPSLSAMREAALVQLEL
jgi:shikimate dehydrogenase